MDEYISRQEAIRALYEVYEYDYPTASGDFDEYARHDVQNVLNGLPPADVQPVKHGRWINEGFLDMYCSHCGETPDSESGSCPTPTDFCPYCGARMDGDSE